VRRSAPTGFVAFGGAGYGSFSGIVSQSCGSVESCSGSNSGFLYSVGVEYWVRRYLAVEASYMKPATVQTEGNGTGFTFNDTFDAGLFTLAGKVGVPLGPVRPYGRVGADYHEATLDLSETIDARVVTVDDVEQTLPGGSINRQVRTAGWSWFWAGGVEGWVTGRVAIFGEGGHARLRGPSQSGGEPKMEDSLNWAFAGIRVRIF